MGICEMPRPTERVAAPAVAVLLAVALAVGGADFVMTLFVVIIAVLLLAGNE